jgi:hypothetical protein
MERCEQMSRSHRIGVFKGRDKLELPFFNKELTDYIYTIAELVDKSKHLPSIRNLNAILNDDDIEHLRTAIRHDFYAGEGDLEKLNELFIKSFFLYKPERSFSLNSICKPHCKRKADKVTRVESYIPTHSILEDPFSEDNIQYLQSCIKGCTGKSINFTSMFNVSVAGKDRFESFCKNSEKLEKKFRVRELELVDRIITRVKFVDIDRMCGKFVDHIYNYRSQITDLYSISLIVNGYENAKKKSRMNKWMDIKNQDDICYNVAEYIKEKFSLGIRDIDDKLKKPRVRESGGRISLYRAIHLDIPFRGIRLECVIKDEDVFRREGNPNDPIYHGRLEETQKRDRSENWGEKEQTLYNLLYSLFEGCYNQNNLIIP